MHVKDYKVLAALAKSKEFGPVRLAKYAEHENHSYMSRLMAGKPGTGSVTAKTARLIAEALDVPVDLLFREDNVKSVDLTRTRGRAA